MVQNMLENSEKNGKHEKDKILIDTDIWIDYLDGSSEFHKEAIKIINLIRNVKCVVSSILITEVNTGYYKIGEKEKAQIFIKNLRKIRNLKIISINGEIADKAAELRASYGLSTPDTIIASTAIISGAKVIYTRNLKHFSSLVREGIEVKSNV